MSWGLTYKGIMGITLLIQAGITLLIAYIPQQQFFYMLWVLGAMFIFGGHFSLTSGEVVNILGRRAGGNVYQVLYYSFPCSCGISFFILYFMYGDRGYPQILKITGILSLVAFGILILLYNKQNYN